MPTRLEEPMTDSRTQGRTDPQLAIRVRGLRKAFGDVVALDGIDLEAAPGTVLGLLGPNGAGKTTAVRVMATLLKPDAGEVRGRRAWTPSRGERAARADRPGGPVRRDRREPDRAREPRDGRPPVRHVRAARRPRAGASCSSASSLTEAAGRPAKTYSGGMRRRLDLGAALVAKPPVLFLDEPTTGLDPRSRLELWTTIEELVAEGTTVLLTTQYLDEADRLADTIAVIDHGRVIADGHARRAEGPRRRRAPGGAAVARATRRRSRRARSRRWPTSAA